MEIRDGFIVSVFNYCDRWCEVCSLTSHCRLFADLAQADAERDTSMADVFAAVRRPPEMLAATQPDASEDESDESEDLLEREMSSEHKAICERALAYTIWVYEWLHDNQVAHTVKSPTDPVSIILWYASLNSSKIHRALTGLAQFDGDREFPPDHEGSAKVALIGLDRSLDAWRQLASERRVAEAVVRPCIDELSWMKSRLEAAIPYARAFVRPGFDEPEAVQTLLAPGRA